jgi:uncharacterized protein YbjQ (UPF0145 family)
LLKANWREIRLTPTLAAPAFSPSYPLIPMLTQVPDVTLTNLECVPGKTIVEHYGVVQGSTIRAKHIGRDLAAGFKNIFGGELKGYTELLKESREEAASRMVAQAREMGANAVINIRFATSSVAQGAAEILAYGTAVRVE